MGTTAIGAIVHFNSHAEAIVQLGHLKLLLLRGIAFQVLGHQRIIKLDSVVCNTQRGAIPIVGFRSLGLDRVFIVFADLGKCRSHTACDAIAIADLGAVVVIGRVAGGALVPGGCHQDDLLVLGTVLAFLNQLGILLTVRIVLFSIQHLNAGDDIGVTVQPPTHVVGDVAHVERALGGESDDGVHHRRSCNDNPTATIHVEDIRRRNTQFEVLELVNQREVLGSKFAVTRLTGHVVAADGFCLLDSEVVGLGHRDTKHHRHH